MKTLAIDPGTRRIGLAACDELELTTRMLPMLKVAKLSQSIPQLVELIRREGFQRVIIGHPLNMDGTESEAGRRSKALGRDLEQALAGQSLACEVVFWDERLTTFEAEQRVRRQGISKAKAKAFLDSLAAEVLLEDFLEHKNKSGRETP